LKKIQSKKRVWYVKKIAKHNFYQETSPKKGTRTRKLEKYKKKNKGIGLLQ